VPEFESWCAENDVNDGGDSFMQSSFTTKSTGSTGSGVQSTDHVSSMGLPSTAVETSTGGPKGPKRLLHVGGGGAASEVLLTILADVLDADVVVRCFPSPFDALRFGQCVCVCVCVSIDVFAKENISNLTLLFNTLHPTPLLPPPRSLFPIFPHCSPVHSLLSTFSPPPFVPSIRPSSIPTCV
jgi:hypothetical protein